MHTTASGMQKKKYNNRQLFMDILPFIGALRSLDKVTFIHSHQGRQGGSQECIWDCPYKEEHTCKASRKIFLAII